MRQGVGRISRHLSWLPAAVAPTAMDGLARNPRRRSQPRVRYAIVLNCHQQDAIPAEPAAAVSHSPSLQAGVPLPRGSGGCGGNDGCWDVQGRSSARSAILAAARHLQLQQPQLHLDGRRGSRLPRCPANLHDVGVCPVACSQQAPVVLFHRRLYLAVVTQRDCQSQQRASQRQAQQPACQLV